MLGSSKMMCKAEGAKSFDLNLSSTGRTLTSESPQEFRQTSAVIVFARNSFSAVRSVFSVSKILSEISRSRSCIHEVAWVSCTCIAAIAEALLELSPWVRERCIWGSLGQAKDSSKSSMEEGSIEKKLSQVLMMMTSASGMGCSARGEYLLVVVVLRPTLLFRLFFRLR